MNAITPVAVAVPAPAPAPVLVPLLSAASPLVILPRMPPPPCRAGEGLAVVASILALVSLRSLDGLFDLEDDDDDDEEEEEEEDVPVVVDW